MRTEKHKYIILPNTNNTKPFCGRRPMDSRAAHAHMQDDSNSPPQEPRGKYWTENLARQAHIQTTPAPPVFDASESNNPPRSS